MITTTSKGSLSDLCTQKEPFFFAAVANYGIKRLFADSKASWQVEFTVDACSNYPKRIFVIRHLAIIKHKSGSEYERSYDIELTKFDLGRHVDRFTIPFHKLLREACKLAAQFVICIIKVIVL